MHHRKLVLYCWEIFCVRDISLREHNCNSLIEKYHLQVCRATVGFISKCKSLWVAFIVLPLYRQCCLKCCHKFYFYLCTGKLAAKPKNICCMFWRIIPIQSSLLRKTVLLHRCLKFLLNIQEMTTKKKKKKSGTAKLQCEHTKKWKVANKSALVWLWYCNICLFFYAK